MVLGNPLRRVFFRLPKPAPLRAGSQALATGRDGSACWQLIEFRRRALGDLRAQFQRPGGAFTGFL